jgi:hypothetical protein
MTAAIKITYDGRLALTIGQAAARYGLSPDAMKKALRGLAVDPLPDPLDGRTPLYLAAELDQAMKARPGRGANLRGQRRGVRAHVTDGGQP